MINVVANYVFAIYFGFIQDPLEAQRLSGLAGFVEERKIVVLSNYPILATLFSF